MMRAGWVVSAIGHVGAVLMTMLAWEARSELPVQVGAVVPVEIVDIAAESNVRALAEETPEDQTPAPQDEAHEAQPAPEPVPTPAPPPPPRPRSDQFDLAAIAGMIDKQKTPGRERQEGARAERTQRGAGAGTADVAALEDRVRALTRAHLLRCWRAPIDLPDPERLVVTVQFELDRNGNIRGQPRVTEPRNYTFDQPMRVAAEAALRAVRMCEPYPFPGDNAVGDHYEVWQQLEYTFRPRL